MLMTLAINDWYAGSRKGGRREDYFGPQLRNDTKGISSVEQRMT
jgi:hypothetical protein